MSTIATIPAAKTMTSREMSEVTEKRHDSVKRTIDTLAANGVISQPQIVDGIKSANGITEIVYSINERDSYIVVAQLSPEFTARLVDRWRALEAGPASLNSTIDATKLFEALFGICQLIGLDKNVSAISANQGATTLTGANLLHLVGQTHLVNPEQEQYFTPTELGKARGISGQKMNALLAAAGLQVREGAVWVVTSAGAALSRIYDTGKKHGSGVPVQQVKWTATAVK